METLVEENGCLKEENGCLKEKIRKKDELVQQMTSKQKEHEAEIARLKRELEEKNRQFNVMADAVGVIREQQNFSTNKLGQFKDELESLKNHVYLNGSQNITQPADTDRYYAELLSDLMTDENTQAEARIQPWTQQQYIAQGQAALPESWTNQGCQATAATPSLTLTAGTSRIPQTSQSTATFLEKSDCLLDSWLNWEEETRVHWAVKLEIGPWLHAASLRNGESSTYRDYPSPTFGFSMKELVIDRGQGSPAPTQPLTSQHSSQTLATSIGDSDSQRNIGGNSEQARCVRWGRMPQFFRFREVRTENPQQALEDEYYQLKQEIQEKDKQEELMKFKLEEDEAEIARLKWEIKAKEQLMKSKLEAFEVENVILMREIEEKEQKMKYNREAFEAKNGRLEHEIEENERLMKSNMEAFEAKNGKLKLEIGEKEQPMKSYLESFEAENERLKREIEQKKQLMKSNLKAFEAQDGRLEHEIQEKKQLVKSKLETLEVEIRQLVAVNLKMQTHQGN